MLSKYTGLFLGIGAFLAMAAHRGWRRHFMSIHPYLAALFALALVSPVILWNAQHEWASFRFQFSERFTDQAFSPLKGAAFAGVQLVVATPVLLAGYFWFSVRVAQNRRRWFAPKTLVVLCFSLPLFLLMAQKSLRYDIHLNWTMPVYLSVMPAVCHLGLAAWRHGRGLNRMRPFWRRAAVSTVIVCGGFNVLALSYLLILQDRTGWMSAVGPWPELAAAVEAIEQRLEAETGREPVVVAEGKYRLASVLAFYRTPLEGTVRASDYTTSQWLVGGIGLGFPYWAPASRWHESPMIVVGETNHLAKFAEKFQHFQLASVLNAPGNRAYGIGVANGRRD
jgi:dolichol-phosphate mannosyltransferase